LIEGKANNISLVLTYPDLLQRLTQSQGLTRIPKRNPFPFEVLLRRSLPGVLLLFQSLGPSQSSPLETPKSVALNPVAAVTFDFHRIDDLVEPHIAARETPGAVVLFGHQTETLFLKAYGWRSLEPEREKLSVNTIFDLASLTKVIATTPAIMMLYEQGKLALTDPITKYIPEFGRNKKKRITIQDLLTHYSGLPPDLKLSKRRKIPSQSLLTKIYQVRPVCAPGQRFIYSDLGFVILGKIVERVSGQSLDRFVRVHLLQPLAMDSSGFLPKPADKCYIAPTERLSDGSILRGQVHDPLASRLGGVAGDAGVFSTAGDLAKFCEMMLREGLTDKGRILRKETVAKMTSVQSPAGKPNLRGLGWDIQSTYSSVKGNFFSALSYGHTGFTGTSIWIDPSSQTYLIILTNRVHPDGGGNVKGLRSELADFVGRLFATPATVEQQQLTKTEPKN